MTKCKEDSICILIERVNALQQQLYELKRIYHTPVTGLQVVIRPDQHNLPSIRGYLLLDGSGNSVTVAFRLFTDLMVEIDSNVDMTGLTLYLF